MVTYIGIFLLGTIAGLAISLITMDMTFERLISNMQFVEIEDKEDE